MYPLLRPENPSRIQFPSNFMRIDKYLKVSRLVKRRTIANEICDAGNASVNGKPIKASYNVSVGDIIELKLGARTVTARVEAVDEAAGKDRAKEMYTII